MNIALVGYGRMGRIIATMALERGHTIGLIIDADNADDLNLENLRGIDVAIEFSIPHMAFNNVSLCLDAGVPVVSGTTGWTGRLGEIEKRCNEEGKAFLHASNFSIGVNIMFHLNRKLSRMMEKYGEYRVSLTETHHTKKLDAPSGTAITLANDIVGNNYHYTGWTESHAPDGDEVPVISIREGEVPGTHIVKWRCNHDEISIKHEAFSRDGFAMGAMLAAEYIIGKSGFLTMNDLLGF